MSEYLIYDIVIGLVLLVSVFLGWRRGLVLSLLGLVAVMVALVGGSLVANTFAPTVAQYFQPTVEGALATYFEDSALSEALEEFALTDGFDDLPEGALSQALQDAGISQTLTDMVADLSQDGVALVSDVATALAESATVTVAYLVIFLLAFVLILILWTAVSHLLNLVAKLPVLSAVNGVGGGVFGLLRGALLLYIVVWLIQLIGLDIPVEALSTTYLLPIFLGEKPVAVLSDLLPSLVALS